MSAALDASALLAYLQAEPGSEAVAAVIEAGGVISAVNVAEVLGKRAEAGDDPHDLARRLVDAGLLGGALEVADLGLDDAVQIAKLRPPTRAAGLSLADRACLALARRREVPAVTADSAWAHVDVGVVVRTIR